MEFCELAAVNEKVINLMVFIGFGRFLVCSSLCLVVFMSWVGVLAIAPNLAVGAPFGLLGCVGRRRGLERLALFLP